MTLIGTSSLGVQSITLIVACTHLLLSILLICSSSAVRLLEGRTNGTFLCRPALKSHDPVCIEGEAHTHTIDLM